MFYKAIAAFSTGHMETGGSLYVEVGENHASELQKWLLDNCFKFVTIKQDINGKNRMIKANNFFC
jgi:methylase of polypeptide subunit release factors